VSLVPIGATASGPLRMRGDIFAAARRWRQICFVRCCKPGGNMQRVRVRNADLREAIAGARCHALPNSFHADCRAGSQGDAVCDLGQDWIHVYYVC